MSILAKVIASLVWSVVVGLLAKRKNLNPWAWGFAGAISWVIALVFLAFQPYRCAKCKRAVAKSSITANGCAVCNTLPAHSAISPAGVPLSDSAATKNMSSEPSLVQTLLMPLLLVGVVAVALIYVYRPSNRHTAEQPPPQVEQPLSKSKSPDASNLSITPPATPLKADKTIFLTSPEINSPCKALPGVHSVDEGVKYLLDKYGNKAMQVTPAKLIKDSGQLATMIQLPTENASAVFALMDGTLKQCDAFFDSVKLKIESAHSEPSPHSTENWVRVGATLDGSRTDYLDTNSVKKDNSGLVRLTVRQEFVPPQTSHTGTEIVETKVILVLDCKEGASAVSQVDQFDKHKKNVEHIKPEKMEWVITSETDSSLRGSLYRSHCKSPGVQP